MKYSDMIYIFILIICDRVIGAYVYRYNATILLKIAYIYIL